MSEAKLIWEVRSATMVQNDGMRLHELLADDWEPFAVTSTSIWPVVWVRKKVLLEEA